MYDEFATYSQIATISEFSSVLFGLGLGIIIYKMLSTEKEGHSTIITTCFYVALVTFALVSVLAFSLNHVLANMYKNPSLVHAINVSVLYIGSSLPINILSGVMIFHGQLKPLYIVSTITNLARFLLLYLATHVFHNFDVILIGFTILNLATMGVYYLFTHHYFRHGIFDFSLFKKMSRDGIPLSANSILGKFIFLTGGIFVSQLIGGTKDYAIYRNGAFEMPFISTIYSALSIIIFPEVAKMIGSGQLKEVVSFKKKVSFNTALLVYPAYIFFVFFGTEFIRVYLSDKFKDSASIFIIFNALLLLRINDYEDILINMGKSRVILIVYVLTALINVITNYFFIKYVGAIGGAIATPFSVLVMVVILQVVTCRVLKNKATDFFDFKKIFVILCISVLVGSALYYSTGYFLNTTYKFLDVSIKAFLFFGILAFIFYKLRFIDPKLIQFVTSKLTIRKKNVES